MYNEYIPLKPFVIPVQSKQWHDQKWYCMITQHAQIVLPLELQF